MLQWRSVTKQTANLASFVRSREESCHHRAHRYTRHLTHIGGDVATRSSRRFFGRIQSCKIVTSSVQARAARARRVVVGNSESESVPLLTSAQATCGSDFMDANPLCRPCEDSAIIWE